MPVDMLDPATALVLVDLQKGITALPTVHDTATVVARAAVLAEAAHRGGRPVVRVRTQFSPDGGDLLRGRTDSPGPAITPGADFADLDPRVPVAADDLHVTKRGGTRSRAPSSTRVCAGAACGRWSSPGSRRASAWSLPRGRRASSATRWSSHVTWSPTSSPRPTRTASTRSCRGSLDWRPRRCWHSCSGTAGSRPTDRTQTTVRAQSRSVRTAHHGWVPDSTTRLRTLVEMHDRLTSTERRCLTARSPDCPGQRTADRSR